MGTFSITCFLFLNIALLLVEIPSTRSQDVTSFLDNLMKNYVAKNTRYYTLVNGVRVQESVDEPPDTSEMASRISSVLPPPFVNSPVLTQILEQDANNFPNSWSPIISKEEDSGYGSLPYLSPYDRMDQRYGKGYPLRELPYPEESKIITLGDIEQPVEFQIGSTMSFN